MSDHQLQKSKGGWHCLVCNQQWKGKPRRECPGVIVYGIKNFGEVPSGLKSLIDLAAKNLKPKGNPAGCVLDGDRIHWLFSLEDTEQLYPYPILRQKGELKTYDELQALNRSCNGVIPQGMMREYTSELWKFFYRLEDCPIANPDLPPIYPWSDRPDNLKTANQLKRFNLKPGTTKPRGCSWDRWKDKWSWLYDPMDEGFEILDPTLPYCYHYESEVPPEFKSKAQLPLFNLKLLPSAIPKACYRIWQQYSKHEGNWETIYLYHRDDCEIDDPSLPPCYEVGSYPADWKTEEELKDINLTPGSAPPQGCLRCKDYNKIKTTLLYHPEDCQWQARDRYVCKTTLRRTYLLSDGWIRRIGSPDKIRENPHHEKWSEMQLYSKQRVEKFLAENAEEYAQWLDERDRYIAIFEQHREAIAAGRATARETRARARIEEDRRRQLEYQRRNEERLGRRVARQFELDMSSDPVRAQTIRCLRCASGCVMEGGFLCAVHPMGLELHQIPCPDWNQR